MPPSSASDIYSKSAILGLFTGLLFSALALLISCGALHDEEDTPIGEPTDVPMVLNLRGPEHVGPLFELNEDLVLGVDEGEPDWQIFGSSVDLELGKNGRMYIGTQPSRTVMIVSPEGRLLGQFGGRGSGPGEFLYRSQMLWIESEQELWVEDTRLYRISRFSADGRLIDTMKYGADGGAFQWVRHLKGTHFLGARPYHTQSSPNRYLKYGFLDERLRWQRDFVTVLSQRMWRASEVRREAFPARFDARPRLVATSEGKIILSDPTQQWITIYSAGGEPAVRFKREWDLHTVTAEERSSWAEIVRRNSFPGFAKGSDLPESRPPFHAVIPDEEGRIWVQLGLSAEEEPEDIGPFYDRPGPNGFRFDIFDEQGQWLGSQRLDFVPAEISSGYAYEARRGTETKGPRIIRYSLTPLVPLK